MFKVGDKVTAQGHDDLVYKVLKIAENGDLQTVCVEGRWFNRYSEFPPHVVSKLDRPLEGQEGHNQGPQAQ